MSAPNLTLDQLEAKRLEEVWNHARQVAWVREHLTQPEIDRLAIAAVECFVERCGAAAKSEAA